MRREDIPRDDDEEDDDRARRAGVPGCGPILLIALLLWLIGFGLFIWNRL